jgi:N-acylneuraminate cytidylyltransferase
MKKIAIIPARGGSKRIPRKNIKDFFGKPVIAYPIELALKSGLFDCVMVSTEDEEIKGIAQDYGAEVPYLRNKKNATDSASTFDVLEEVIKWYDSNGQKFDYACCIYPVTPLLRVEFLEIAFKKLINGKCDSVIPIAAFSHPIQRALSTNKDGLIQIKDKKSFIQNTQYLHTYYHDTGQFYWFNSRICFKKKELLTNKSSSIILTNNQFQDVDNIEDWEELEYKFKYNLEK